MNKLIYASLTILCYLLISSACGQQKNRAIPGTSIQQNVNLPNEDYAGILNILILNKNSKSSNSLFWQWNTVTCYNEQNILTEKYTQTFDANGLVLIQLKETKVNNVWVNNLRYTYTYNTNGNLLTMIMEEWLNSSWWLKYKYTYSYYTNGNLMTALREQWVNNAWVNNLKATANYDTNGNIMNRLYEVWDNNSWINWFRNTFSYNGNGNLQIVLIELWTNNAWENNNRVVYTYNSNGYIHTQTFELWFDGEWGEAGLNTYTYDANNNLITDLYDSGLGTYAKSSYSYDVNGNSLTGKAEYEQNGNWLPLTDNLEIFSQQESYYDYFYVYRYEASFSSFINTSIDKPADFIDFLTYPNPAADKLTIEIPSFTSEQEETISIYNIRGQLVKQQLMIHGKTEIDILELPKGIYVLKFSYGDKFGVTKFFKE